MSKEQKMSDYDRGYLHGFDDAMEKPYEQREQEQISLPAPFRAQGQQIASDGDDKAFCDLYSKEQMLAYGKASELAIDKTRVKRIATQLGWMPPLDVEQEPVAWNKSIRDSVDSLLAQAGFELDSSVRHQLAMMNFESTTVPLKNWRNAIPGGRHTDQWESCRVADYNKGWNEYRKAAKAALEKLEVAPPPPQQKEQEPVAKVRIHKTGGNAGISWSAAPVNDFDSLPLLQDGALLYTATPQREWQGLTVEEAVAIYKTIQAESSELEFAKAIEAKLKEKNAL